MMVDDSLLEDDYSGDTRCKTPNNAFPTTALAVPDPRSTNVPAGWWDAVARPVIESADWDRLDEIEGQINAVAAFIEAMGRDRLEFEKALRTVECRRGVLAGPNVRRGARTDLNSAVKVPADVSPMTLSRYRNIARAWNEKIFPHLLRETDHRKVTQAFCLMLGRAAVCPEPIFTTVDHDLATDYRCPHCDFEWSGRAKPTVDRARIERDADLAAILRSVVEPLLTRCARSRLAYHLRAFASEIDASTQSDRCADDSPAGKSSH